jgi:Protein of unknown function (DUF2505)
MRITERIEHAADPARVYAMLVDTDYQHERCRRSGSTEHEVTLEETPSGLVVVTRRRMPTDDLPDPFAGFVGAHVDVVETTQWGGADDDGARQAAYTLDVDGTPVDLVGGVHLAPGGVGTVHTVDGELRAHVPLLGSRIEDAVAPVVTRALELEQELGREWLQR